MVQLPGREDRSGEPCLVDIMAMAELIADAVVAEQAADFALFGHSFGALVMLETARALERKHAPAPAVLAVAACAPPHLPGLDRFDELAPAQIFDVLHGLGGMDFSGPRGDQLKPLVLPALTADARASTRYLDAPGQGTITAPILAMGASHDPAVALTRLAEWSSYTGSGAVVREYPGGHFFPLESDLPLRAVLDWRR